ncbi:MAG: hypothetical protein ACPGRW_06165 [Flavobacteriaceae bacterium]
MYLIDSTYFIKDLIVPNKGVSLDIPNNEESLDQYIDKYARQLLQNALGSVLFDELDSNITNGILDPGADQKWKDLVNGKSYTLSGTAYKWKGLLFTEGAFKGSILAQYTYYHWHLDQLSRMSRMGEVKGSAVNAQAVNSTSKSVKVWNQYIEMYQGYQSQGYTFSYVNGVPFHDYFNTNNSSDYVCLLEFLIHNETDYPDAAIRVEKDGFKNSMGL